MTAIAKFLAGSAAVVLFAAAGLFGTDYLLSESSSASGGGDGGPQPVRVGVAAPETVRIDDAVSAIGTLAPIRSVELRPAVAGRVTEVAVASGDEVAAGALMVQLDDRAAQAALADAEATLAEARQELERVKELAEANTAATRRLEAARAAFGRAQAAVTAARADLEDRAIRAPFAGTVGLIDIEPGAYLDAGATLGRLSDLSVMRVDLALPERYFGRVGPGQSVTLRTPAYGDDRFAGRVTVKAPEIARDSRSFDVRAEIDNADRRLVGGMFADTRLVFETYEGLAIPDDAIISEGMTSYVYTVENDRATRSEIGLGTSLGPLTEVTEGLEQDARIVVAGWDTLSDAAPVRIDEDFARDGLR